MTPRPSPFRVAFVPGVTPGKWERAWAERVRDRGLESTLVDEAEQVSVLHDGRAEMSFVRLPVEGDDLHVIPLYREVPVVVVPREHPVAAYDEIDLAELADELVLDDPGLSVRLAIETVAAGTGIVIVPKSVARLYARKDVTSRPVTGVAESEVGLAWPRASADPHLETFVGIVRGRTAQSSRGSGATAMPTAKNKPAAKKATPRKQAVRAPGRRRSARDAGTRRRGR